MGERAPAVGSGSGLMVLSRSFLMLISSGSRQMLRAVHVVSLSRVFRGRGLVFATLRASLFGGGDLREAHRRVAGGQE